MCIMRQNTFETFGIKKLIVLLLLSKRNTNINTTIGNGQNNVNKVF